MESGVAEHVSQHKGRAEVMAYVVVRGSIVASDVKWVLQQADTGVCVQDAERLIGDAPVGDIVERMTPRVIHIETDACRKTALKAEGQSVVARVTGREILRYRPEREVRRSGWQTGKTAGADRAWAITVQPFVAYRNVNAVHAGVIHSYQHLRADRLFYFEIPLVISGLVEGIGKRKEIRRGESRNRCGNRVEGPTGFELRKQSLIGLRDGGEKASSYARRQRAIADGEGIESRRVECRILRECARQFVCKNTSAGSDDSLGVTEGLPSDADPGLPYNGLGIGIRVMLAGEDYFDCTVWTPRWGPPRR